MFLLLCVGVVAAAFWISALLAAAFMTSAGERALAPGVRVGFGFMLSMVYFSGAWQVMSIGQAWALAIAMLAVFAWARFGLPRRGALAGAARHLRAEYGRTFGAFVAGALLFFGPFIAAQTLGPFTEGGGDVSIYADTAKYMADRGLTEFGLPSRDAADLAANVRELALQGGGPRPGADKSPLMNPPSAEYGPHRILVTRTMSPFLYTPFVAYSFLAGSTNYHVFYGLQCFVYVCLLAAVWGFFLRYGRRMALLGGALAALSHSLVSLFYNTYSAQGVALLASALVLAALAHVRLPGWAALRTYGSVLLITWITYVHYLSVVVPMACVAAIPAGAALAGARDTIGATVARLSGWRRYATWIPAGAFALAFCTLAYAGTLKSFAIGKLLMGVALSRKETAPEMLTYMGTPVPAFGTQWSAFLFGLVSQQHFSPFMREYAFFPELLRVGSIAAAACCIAGAVAMLRWAHARRGAWRPALQDAAIYAAALVTVAVHLYLVRTSLYTQAKGAQNILVLVFTMMLLPLALTWRDMPATRVTRVLLATMKVSLVAFIVVAVVVRGMFGYRLGFALDRAGILEPSFFAEAERIRRSDPEPLVLFEPRKSADLYTSNQSFFGARMLPTRELVLQRSRMVSPGRYEASRAMAVEFIERSDLPHVWTLRAKAEPRWPWLNSTLWDRIVQQRAYTYTWHAERLVDRATPGLLLSGDTYERPYGELPLGAEEGGARALFNFVRNGVASLYLPGGAARVEVELHPREGGYLPLEAEIRGRAAAGEFGPDVEVTGTGKVVRLSYAFPAAGEPSLRTVARYKGEFFVNVKVDGKDMP